MTYRQEITTITVKQQTHVRLLSLSKNCLDSFDNVIGRLIDEHLGHEKNKELQQKIFQTFDKRSEAL